MLKSIINFDTFFSPLFLDTIESLVPANSEEVPQNAVHVFDGMVILQQLENAKLSTFGQLSEHILQRVLKAKEVFFVTDQYLVGSIKSFERAKRGKSGSLRIRIERREQARPRQWSKYLKDGQNKTELIQFLLDDWADPFRYRVELTDRTVFFNCKSKFFKLTCDHGDQVIIAFH